MWPNERPLRRAARYDGVFPIHPNPFERRLKPDEFREIIAYVRKHRTSADPFDVVHSGESTGADREADAALVRSYEDAGITWWLEDLWFDRHGRIGLGPPSI